MTDKNPLTTVIIPAYNSESSIEKCLDSLATQTYSHFEVIVVNDGSTDKTEEICKKFIARYSFIRTINQRNKGVSEARNSGLAAAKGDYIVFVDSDDYVKPEYLETLVEVVLNSSADIGVCNYLRVSDGNCELASKSSPKLFGNFEAIRDIFSERSLCEVVLWNKIYNIKLFKDNNIIFPSGKINEDDAVMYKLFYYSNKIAYDNRALYYYVQRHGSIMHNGYSSEYLDIFETLSETKRWLEELDIPVLREFNSYQLSTYINIINRMIDNDSFDKKIWSKAAKWCGKNMMMIVSNETISTSHKNLACIVLTDYRPYKIFRKLYNKRKSI